jgi:hypothetical protein
MAFLTVDGFHWVAGHSCLKSVTDSLFGQRSQTKSMGIFSFFCIVRGGYSKNMFDYVI